MNFIYSGSADLASPWQARPHIDRKMPDVTDVGTGQVWQTGQKNDVRRNVEELTTKDIELKVSLQKSYPASSLMSQNVNAIPEEEFKNSLKKLYSSASTVFPSKEDTNPDNLIYLNGPCTEASIIKILRSRFTKKLFQVCPKGGKIPNYIPLFIDLDRTCVSPTGSTHKQKNRL